MRIKLAYQDYLRFRDLPFFPFKCWTFAHLQSSNISPPLHSSNIVGGWESSLQSRDCPDPETVSFWAARCFPSISSLPQTLIFSHHCLFYPCCSEKLSPWRPLIHSLLHFDNKCLKSPLCARYCIRYTEESLGNKTVPSPSLIELQMSRDMQSWSLLGQVWSAMGQRRGATRISG